MPGAVDDVLALDRLLAARTPVTAPPAVSTSVTATPSMTRTPSCRAPLASDTVRSTGLTRPSSGMWKPGEQVVGLGPREQVSHLGRRDLVDLQAEVALERSDAAVLLEPVGVGGGLDHPDRA